MKKENKKPKHHYFELWAGTRFRATAPGFLLELYSLGERFSWVFFRKMAVARGRLMPMTGGCRARTEGRRGGGTAGRTVGGSGASFLSEKELEGGFAFVVGEARASLQPPPCGPGDQRDVDGAGGGVVCLRLGVSRGQATLGVFGMRRTVRNDPSRYASVARGKTS